MARLELRRNPQRRKQRVGCRKQRLESLEPRHLLAGDLNVSEIMYSPASGKAADEWIEFHNSGDQAIELLNYRIAAGVDFTFPEYTLAPNQYLVVAADVDAFSAAYPDVTDVVGGWSGRLSNRSEDIEVEDSAGNLVDRAVYADSGDWAVRRRAPLDNGVQGWEWLAPHDGEGFSLELVNRMLPHDIGHNWATSTSVGGSPGQASPTESSNIAPAIVDTAHHPIIPTSSEDVQITTRIVDESSRGLNVALFYRESTLEPGEFIRLPMFDDAEHGDQIAGNGVFGVTIPALPHETVVEFYVQAQDESGQIRTSPAATDNQGAQEANLLYQVDDTDRPADVPVYRTIMTAGERRQFARMNRLSDAQMNATFISSVGDETELRYNVGVRYRGSGTRQNTPANNRINFPSDRDWNGATQININANNPFDQIAGSVVFGLAGVAAADAIPIRLLGNGEDLGRGNYFAHLEV